MLKIRKRDIRKPFIALLTLTILSALSPMGVTQAVTPAPSKNTTLVKEAYQSALDSTLKFISKNPYTLRLDEMENSNTTSREIRVDSKLNAAVYENNTLIEVYIKKNWFTKTAKHDFQDFERAIANKHKIDLNRTWTLTNASKFDSSVTDYQYLELLATGGEIDDSLIDSVDPSASWTIQKNGSEVTLTTSNKKSGENTKIVISNGILTSITNNKKNYRYKFSLTPKASKKIIPPSGPYLDWASIRLAREYGTLYSLFRATISADSVKAVALSLANGDNRAVPSLSDWQEAARESDVYPYNKGFEIVVSLDKTEYKVCAVVSGGDYDLSPQDCVSLGLSKLS